MQNATLATRLDTELTTRKAHEAGHAGSWLDPDEERRLIAALQRGDSRAGDTLLRAHQGFLRSIARGYRLWGADLDDLVQQGSIGLLKAAQRFDPSRAHNLRTYAGYWIRAEIREYVVRGYRIVRLGTTRTERKALRAYRVHEVSDAAELAKQSGMPLARCEQLWPLITRRDTRIDDHEGHGLDRVARNEDSPEAQVLRHERTTRVHDQVQAALSGLSKRERRIVEARMMSDEPSTLDALGVELGLSRERVRQIEAAIKTKMREKLTADLAA
jgi:RNA polymerase sigma-32 factor